jgi:hypothetical protein
MHNEGEIELLDRCLADPDFEQRLRGIAAHIASHR